jgi:hypothetical protein
MWCTTIRGSEIYGTEVNEGNEGVFFVCFVSFCFSRAPSEPKLVQFMAQSLAWREEMKCLMWTVVDGSLTT